MPTYEYKCNRCGHHFEEFQSMNDKPIESCPKCNGKVKRLIGAGAGMIFKGSGFYLTDYKRSNASPAKSKGETRSDKPGKATEQTPAKSTPAKTEKQHK